MSERLPVKKTYYPARPAPGPTLAQRVLRISAWAWALSFMMFLATYLWLHSTQVLMLSFLIAMVAIPITIVFWLICRWERRP